MFGSQHIVRDPDRCVKVMVVEDIGRTREALGALIGGSPGFELTGAYRSAAIALEKVPSDQPVVILVDLEMPGMSGLEFIRSCRARHPEIAIVVHTVHGEANHVFTALSAGAVGYLLKGLPPAKLLESIAEVASGGAWMSGQIARMVLRTLTPTLPLRSQVSCLSHRELEVLQLLSQGHPYGRIAQRLSISIRTVNTHLQTIYKKLHVHSATGAIAKLLKGD